MSAILLDLDHFKEINDTYGHERGDEVLAAVGALMRAELRGSDFAGRNGGEEFIVMLPDTDRAGAMRVAEHLRKAMHAVSLPGVTRSAPARSVSGSITMNSSPPLRPAKSAPRSSLRMSAPTAARTSSPRSWP